MQSQASVIDFTRQDSTSSVPSARTRLLQVLRSRQPDLFDVATWQRDSRKLHAQSLLSGVKGTPVTNIATALGLTGRCIRYWRDGQHAPSVQHLEQLSALSRLLNRAYEKGARSITR
jgi:hypothetical protein